MDTYDVIIIGTAQEAGRSHAISLRRASASCCSNAAAGCRASPRTGSRRTCSSTTATCRPRRGTTRTASPSSRRSTTSSGARRSSTAPRSTGCARRTSASSATTTASRPPGRSPTTRWSRTTRWPSSSTRCTARGVRIRPSRPRARRTRFLPCRTSRASSSSPTISRPAGYHPFHAPCGVMLDETNMPYSACVRCTNCDGFPCACTAKSDAEVLGVRPALEHPNVTLLTNAEVVRLETNTAGTTVTEVVVERDGGPSGSPPTSSWSPAVQPTPRSCCCSRRATSIPNGLANGSDQVGRNYMFHNSQAVLALSREENPTVFQKTLGLNDFYFGEGRLRVPDREHPDGRQVDRRRCTEARSRVETKLAPEWSLERIAKHAIDFWLSTEDLPRPDNRVTVDTTGKRHAQLHTDERGRRSGCTRSSSRCSASST